jgi:hypothetical protein
MAQFVLSLRIGHSEAKIIQECDQRLVGLAVAVAFIRILRFG